MKTAKDVLSKLLDENSRGKAQSYSSVFGGWRDLAGLSLADHSRVYEIKHHNLFVEVDHNGWVQILLLRKSRILNRLRSRYPELEIRDLKVRINPKMSPAVEPPVKASPATESAGESSTSSAGESSTSSARESASESAPGAAGGASLPAAGPAGLPREDRSAGATEVDEVVSGVSQESLKRQLRKLFLSSLKHKRGPV